MNYTLTIDIDNDLLNEQRHIAMRMIMSGQLDEQEKRAMEGILNLLDSISDEIYNQEGGDK